MRNVCSRGRLRPQTVLDSETASKSTLAAWVPTNFDDACKRNAGRRKLHMRKRKARSDRIVRLLAATDSTHAKGLRAAHGWISTSSQAMQVSKPTASRDCALVRRIHRQFLRMFGRNFDAKRDRVVWTWNWDHYGFITPESKAEGYRNRVGDFPFDTRRQETEESYCGFNHLSWHRTTYISQMSTRDLMRAYGRVLRMRDRLRIPKEFFENFLRQNLNLNKQG